MYNGGAEPVFTTKTQKSMVFDGVKPVQDGKFSHANVSVASAVPLAESVTFKPVTAVICFHTGIAIDEVILRSGHSTQAVAGDISVDPTADTPTATLNGDGYTCIVINRDPTEDQVFINILPGAYPNGLNLTFYSNSSIVGMLNATKSITLKAGDILNLDSESDMNITNLIGFPDGALNGLFSVSPDKKVLFSKGNLRYVASADKWSFYDKQYECAPGYESDTISLFTWGYNETKSIIPNGKNGDNVSRTTGNLDNITEDWGCTIAAPGIWRTLTNDEWMYLLGDNDKRKGLYAYGVTVAGLTNCMVLYPDGWSGTKVSNKDKTSYDTEEEWAAAESLGAVCLPGAGTRNEESIPDYGWWTQYWSSTAYNENNAFAIMFMEDSCAFGIADFRKMGYCVRLVTE